MESRKVEKIKSEKNQQAKAQQQLSLRIHKANFHFLLSRASCVSPVGILRVDGLLCSCCQGSG
jgi:hypothetical protein